MDTTDIADPRVLAITDPDDVPTGQLAKLIAPCAVFSEDRHLCKPGLAPPEWREVAQFGVDLVEGITGQRITGNLAALPFRGGAELIRFLGRKTGISPWIIGGIVVAGAAIVLKSPERRQAISKYAIPVAEAFIKEMEQSTALEQRGLAGLREVLLAALPEPSVKQQAAIVLARQDEPLLARQVQERMLRNFPNERVPTVTELGAALKRRLRVRAARAVSLAVRSRSRAVAGTLPALCRVTWAPISVPGGRSRSGSSDCS